MLSACLASLYFSKFLAFNVAWKYRPSPPCLYQSHLPSVFVNLHTNSTTDSLFSSFLCAKNVSVDLDALSSLSYRSFSIDCLFMLGRGSISSSDLLIDDPVLRYHCYHAICIR
ncbi:hypothetical protein L6164_031556 [Bauhinia variegata]|uniref:Uncharacterized protein n=1 Tax=Bauhinia variegata TaxID=167791 RepID=A0ACB9LG35_BAUVA|nr:hypothetical protein L6164_031556 [Bauhinia variegata]